MCHATCWILGVVLRGTSHDGSYLLPYPISLSMSMFMPRWYHSIPYATLLPNTNQPHRRDVLDTALDALDLDLLFRRERRSDELSEPV
jgi:hypothetical protein